MSAFLSALPAYLQLGSMRAQVWYAYRAQVALELISLVLQVYLLRMIWTAVYAGQASAPGLDLATLVAYLTLAQLQTWVISPKLELDHRGARPRRDDRHRPRPAGALPAPAAGPAGRRHGRRAAVRRAGPAGGLAGGRAPAAGLAPGRPALRRQPGAGLRDRDR